MEERFYSEKPAPKRRREKMRVAGDELVAVVPAVRVRNRVGLDVPTVIVPIRVHSPEHVCAQYHPYQHPSNTLRVVSYSRPQSLPVLRTDSNLFLNDCTHARKELAHCDSGVSAAQGAARRACSSHPRHPRDDYNKKTLLHPANLFAKFQRVQGSERAWCLRISGRRTRGRRASCPGA